MSARKLSLLFTTIGLLFCAFGAAGQQCTKDETPDACWLRFNPVTNVNAETMKNVEATNTGTPSVTTAAAATALQDFLSFFSAGVDTGTVTENGTSVTLDWNAPFAFAKYDRLKFQTVFSDPALAKDVQTPLGTSADTAKSKLTNFDDSTTLVAYDPVTVRLGRSVAPHVGFIDALEYTKDLAAADASQVVGQLLVDFTLPSFVNNKTFADQITDPVKLKAVLVAYAGAATAHATAAANSAAIVKALTQLINNQPQAYVEGKYHYRNELIGPNEWSLKGTFEASPNSLNRFFRDHGDDCGNGGKAAVPNVAKCTSDLVKTVGGDPSTQPDANDRFVVAFEYRQAKTESVDLSDFKIATPVARPGTHSLVYSLKYGHPLTGGTMKNARVDLAANYDNVSNDPKKKDRFVASLTFSQKISDHMTPLLGLTYANHADYLTQADRKLGVHFGLSYKIPAAGGS
jgi:hypothetical protein